MKKILALLFLFSPLQASYTSLSDDKIDTAPEVALINRQFNELYKGKLDLRPGDVIPREDNQYSLGSSSYRWLGISVSSVNVYGYLGLPDGSLTSPSLFFLSDTDLGLYRYGSDSISFVAHSTDVFIVKSYSNGNGVFGSARHLEDTVGTKYVSNFRVSEDTAKTHIGGGVIITENGDTADLVLQRFDGTYSAPTGVSSATWTGYISWNPYDGTDFQPTTIYGGAYESDHRSGPVATNGTTGPFQFAGLDTTIGSDSDIAFFVVPTGTKGMYPSYLKTITADYTYVFHTSSLTLTLASALPAGSDMWVYKRNNFANNNPFYGRQGDIRTIARETPTQYGRAGSMVFSVAKSSEVAHRPRLWVDGITGNTVVAGKSVYEVHDTYNFYPDRFDEDIQSDFYNGAPSGVNPYNSNGKGTLTVIASSHTVDSAIAVRKWNSQTNGFDLDLQLTNDDLRLSSVAADVRTPVITIDRTSGSVSIASTPVTTATQPKLDVWEGGVAMSVSGVAHGLTTLAPTNSYLYISTISATAGGVEIKGLSDTDARPLLIRGVFGTGNPTDTTAAVAIVGAVASGTSNTTMASAETVMEVRNAGTTLITTLGDGNTGWGDTTPAAQIELEDQTGGADMAIFGGQSRYFIMAASHTNVLGIGGAAATRPHISSFPLQITGGGVMKSTGTNPYHTFASVTSTPTAVASEASIWSNFSGGSAEIKVLDGAGNVTTISPHNENNEWEYYSVNVKTGRVVRINMEKMVKKLEEVTGEDFMEEYTDPSIVSQYEAEENAKKLKSEKPAR